MTSTLKPLRLFAAMAAALIAGAGIAVVAAQAGPEAITLEGAVEKRLTIRGPGIHEALTVRGDAGATVALNADRQFVNMRTDCEVVGVVSTNATCEGDFQKIELDLRGGSDELFFRKFVASGARILARGAAGGDRLIGSGARDFFEGGAGGDELRGREGADDLDGGGGHDDCEGGPGHDEVRNCE